MTESNTSRTKKAGSRPAKATSAAERASPTLKVSAAPTQQHEEEIPRDELVVETPASQRAARVVDTPGPQTVEDIKPTPVESNVRRLNNGFKVVQNRAHQRIQKIKPKKLVVPASDEMGYKKLFTKFEEAFLAQDIKGIGECLSPAFQWHQPNGQVVYGKQEALDEMERRFATPNGPKFSKSIWRFEGETVIQRYGVEYMGPDGKWRKSKGLDIYEIGDGLITLKDAFWKMIP